MIPVEEAQRRILEGARRLGVEVLPARAALGRVLAASVVAPRAFPEGAVSAMDGYAVAAASIEANTPYRVSAMAPAGGVPQALATGTVVRIFTGALLPPGADAVIIQENADVDGDRVSFRRGALPGDHVRPAGQDLRAGAVALCEGQRLTAGALMLSASVDAVELLVAQAPRVAFLCTGDELRDPGAPHAPGLIAESNTPGLEALARAVGARVSPSRRVEDSLSRTIETLEALLADHDVVFTVGGASVGDRDHVRPALLALGAEIDVSKVRLKPGKPVMHARLGSKRVIGLPGNPASALVTFALFAVPLLRALQGDRRVHAPALRVALAAPARATEDRVVAAIGALEAGGFSPHGNQASGAMTALAASDGFVLLPMVSGQVQSGTLVSFIAWPA